MPSEFMSTISAIASAFSAPVATTAAIFVYLYFRERKAVDEETKGRLADAKAYAIDLAKEKEKREELAKSYSHELVEVYKARAVDATLFTDRILKNQEMTIAAARELETVIEVLGGDESKRRLQA
jgi:hypothetical protein